MGMTTIVGAVAFVLSAAQLTQMGGAVLRSPDPSGVSRPMWLILLAQAVAWVVFGRVEHLWPSMAINALLLIVAALVLRVLFRDAPQPFALLVAATVALAMLCVALASGGHAGLVGWTATACGLVAFVPQAASLLRTRDTSGLSLGSWSLGLAAIVCWLMYGIGLGAAQVIVSTIPPLLCSLVIVGALVRSRPAPIGTLAR